MSKFYGTLSSDSGEPRTKTGHQWIMATAQSWEGSVSVSIDEEAGKLWVSIRVAGYSLNMPTRLVYRRPLAELVNLAQDGYILKRGGRKG